MLKWFTTLRHDENGAVTIDWVVLVAAMVGLGIAIVTSVGDQQTAMGDRMTSQMSSLANQY